MPNSKLRSADAAGTGRLHKMVGPGSTMPDREGKVGGLSFQELVSPVISILSAAERHQPTMHRETYGTKLNSRIPIL
jgi:hypothetical protein